MTRALGYYDGSTLLQPVAVLFGVGIDEVNFIICQLLCLFLAYAFRNTFSPGQCSTQVRHMIQVAIGLCITFFCFGKQIFHLIAQSITCYIVMKLVRPGIMEKLVFTIAMGYLCIGHMYRLIYDYGNYVLDITGPLMLNTQRVSSLAYSYRDGMRLKKEDDKKLTPFMKRYAIVELPGLLEFASYIFCFHTLMAGPFAFYKDYSDFIDGTNVTKWNKKETTVSQNGNTKHADHSDDYRLPSPAAKVLEKLMCAVFYSSCMIFLTPRFSVTYAKAAEFESFSFTTKVMYVIVGMFVQRTRYYLAWKLVEAVNINTGLGFNGYTNEGKAKWDLVDNVHVVKVEFALSIKEVLDNWNITTQLWLRYVIYERVRSTSLVMMFSAFWHGFYPGYYITYFSCGICIFASRQLRRNLRHYFQKSTSAARFYDCVTFLGTLLALAYFTFPFVLMDFWPSIKIYQQYYFYIHIISFSVIIFFNYVKLSPPRPKQQQQNHSEAVKPESSPVQTSTVQSEPVQTSSDTDRNSTLKLKGEAA